MRYQRVALDTIAYELPAQVVASEALEERLTPLYRKLRLQPGQLAALTGVRERRYWPKDHSMADGALRAARKALASSKVPVASLGILVYAGVCRDQLEPATACAVADGLGLPPASEIYDISNACLGVLNGMVHVADAIETGRVRAGMIVSCESARQIVDLTIERLLAEPTMDNVRLSLATLTGGSGAIALIVADRDLCPDGHTLLGGVIRSRPQHHRLCRWGPDTGIPASAPMRMATDAVAVMEHGVALGVETWDRFLEEMCWTAEQVDRTICHQVGGPHRDAVLAALGIAPERDFQTYEFLGNIGTVSLPITAALAAQRGVLRSGHHVGFLGIGSGLNCLLLGLRW